MFLLTAQQGAIPAMPQSLFMSRMKNKISSPINIFLDSNLVCSQLNGLFKIKKASLRALFFEIKQKEAEINQPIIYQYIPREKNKEADKIVNLVLDNKSLPAASLRLRGRSDSRSSGVSQRDKFVLRLHPRSKLCGIRTQNKF
jgi:hypothetical protein